MDRRGPMDGHGENEHNENEHKGEPSLIKDDLIPAVHQNLKEQLMLKRQDNALDFRKQYNEEGDAFFSRFVIGDKTWVCYVTLESKLQLME
ncbi:hypothetical protein TNCT_644711 [Trichonephila clavata]|uniref:Uncharacterized protein n=1 Tax=Trichonephila clavata TaxID=2740835 RepID=A0A8X6GB19_TRICU|nr:hypothetical protein TNCT_644711 [Trichonephila clavata]